MQDSIEGWMYVRDTGVSEALITVTGVKRGKVRCVSSISANGPELLHSQMYWIISPFGV